MFNGIALGIGATGRVGTGSPAPTALGTVYDKSSWTDLSDFTVDGATVSVVGNKLQFTGGVGNFAQRLVLNKYSALHNYTMTVDAIMDEKSGTSYGYGPGLKSVNTIGVQYDLFAQFLGYTGAGQNLAYGGGSNTALMASSAVAVVWSAGDKVRTSIDIAKNVITVTSVNVTSPGTPAVSTFTFDPAGSGVLFSNTGRFAIYSFGGQFTVDRITITSTDKKNAPIVMVGDSKFKWYSQTTIPNTIASLLEATYTTVTVNAGQGDGVDEHILRLSELQSLTPTTFLLGGLSNNIRAGQSAATINTKYASLVSSLLPYGRVVHTTGLKEDVLDQSSLRTYILANYAVGNIIDTLPNTYGLTDGVHLNNAGAIALTSFLVSSGKL